MTAEKLPTAKKMLLKLDDRGRAALGPLFPDEDFVIATQHGDSWLLTPGSSLDVGVIEDRVTSAAPPEVVVSTGSAGSNGRPTRRRSREHQGRSLANIQKTRVRFRTSGAWATIDRGALHPDGDDSVFESPSRAALDLFGKTCNGWISWFGEDGRSLAEIHDQG